MSSTCNNEVVQVVFRSQSGDPSCHLLLGCLRSILRGYLALLDLDRSLQVLAAGLLVDSLGLLVQLDSLPVAVEGNLEGMRHATS